MICLSSMETTQSVIANAKTQFWGVALNCNKTEHVGFVENCCHKTIESFCANGKCEMKFVSLTFDTCDTFVMLTEYKLI